MHVYVRDSIHSNMVLGLSCSNVWLNMDKHLCRTCGLLTSDFRYVKSKTGKLNRVLDCRECERKKARESRRARYRTAEGKEAILKANGKYLSKPGVVEERALLGKKRYAEDEEFRERAKDNAQRWRITNHERKRQRARQYYQENKSEIQKRTRKKQEKNPWLRLRGNIRSRVCEALKAAGSSKNGQSVFRHLPYSLMDLKNHLELQFEDWMNWSNYGDAWQLDHVVPQALFPYDSMDSENFFLCWDLKNLRPLSDRRNLEEGNRRDLIDYVTFDSLCQDLRDALTNPIVRERPDAIMRKLSRQRALTDACPMGTVGLSYLDSIFTQRFRARSSRRMSLEDAVQDKHQVLRVVVHLISRGERVSSGAILSNLKYLIRTPGHFFPSAAKAIFDTYSVSGTSCFDPCLGWGGRTLGAICSKVDKIVGCDIQDGTVNGCRRVARDLSALSPTKSEFHVGDSLEYLRHTEEKFGLVFTSPPYMDTEDYGVESDSMREDWVDSFVFPLVEQFKRHLMDDGKVALHLKDVKGAPTFTAYHSAMKAFGFKQTARHRYGRTWTQAVYVYSHV